MASESTDVGADSAPALVDPRAPRFGQGITTVGLTAGILLREPLLVFTIAIVLNIAVWSRWRLQPYGILWRRVIAPVLSPPDEPEPAAPHRFATLVGASLSGLGSLAILAGYPLVGYVLAAVVVVAAGLAATTGFCIGCRMYRGVSLVRRLSLG